MSIEKDKSRFVSIVLIALTGVGAILLMLWITELGPGVSFDSIVYIGAARSFLSGQGFLYQGDPIAHYPPVYPFLLAIAGWLRGGDVVQGARFLSIFFFGINVFLFGTSVYVSTKRSLLAAFLSVFLFVISAHILKIHEFAWSEAPFVAFTLTAFLLISIYIIQPKLYLLLLTSLSAGLAVATRYVGIILLPTILFILIFFSNHTLKKKLIDSVLFIFGSSLFVGGWMIRNKILTGTTTNREIIFHVVGWDHLRSFVINLYEFVFPINIATKYKGIQILAVGILALILAIQLGKKNALKQYKNSVGGVLSVISLLFFVAYIAFLVFSISFIDAQTPLDTRLLFPAYLGGVIASFSLVWNYSEIDNDKYVKYIFIILVSVSILINFKPAINQAKSFHNNSSGFNARGWTNSKIIKQTEKYSDGFQIYSNGPEVIYFHWGINTKMIPEMLNPNTAEINSSYEEEMQDMCNQIQNDEAVLVYLNNITWRTFLPSKQDLEDFCNMQILEIYNDGTVYGK